MSRLTADRLIAASRHRLRRMLDWRVVRWYRLGAYQQAWYLRRLFRDLKINLVLDVGGNAGQFARFIRSQVGYAGPMITFEPIPDLAERLRSKARGDPTWTIVEVALGDSTRSDSFNVMESSPLSSMLAPSGDESRRLSAQNRVARRIPIQVQTLDRFFEDQPALAHYRNIYLKLDVQGYERRVLEGATLALERVAALQAELSVVPLYHEVPDYKALMGYIESLGYVLSFIPAHDYEQFPDMLDFDCHFVRREHLEALGLLKPARPHGG